MFGITKKLYGIRIVPKYDRSGVRFGQFEGIVIYPYSTGSGNIEILKMVNRGNRYFVSDSIQIPFEETLKHSRTSGRAKFKFLYSIAKQLVQNDEEIAICSTLVPHLQALDASFVESNKNH